MPEDRLESVAVADLYHVAIPRTETCLDYNTISWCHYRCSRLGSYIHTFMKFQNAAERRGSVAERRSDPSPDRPYGRGRSIERTFVFAIFYQHLEACFLL